MRNIANNYKIIERKSSKFGSVGYVTKGNELEIRWTGKPSGYYDNLKRGEIYTTARDLYVHDQLAHPIVNLIVNATFGKGLDFQGDDTLVKRANEIIRDSEIDWHKLGVDGEVYGDVFLRAFPGEKAKIASIPAETIVIDYDTSNIFNIKGYVQTDNELSSNPLPDGKRISVGEISHIKFNCTSNMVYGSSTLRPIFWWLDVLDNLWEANAIRAIQYYGAPIVVITGVPGDYQAAVKASLEENGQRPGKNWIFPENVKAETMDFTKNYPIQEFIDRAYQYILSACNIPQHLVYESDSSRGVAMFSGDSFEMMINTRRQTWALGIIKALKIIFEDEGIWKDDAKFKIGWAPVFQRDLKDLVNLVEKTTATKLLSKRTARERLGVDHSDELERLDLQKTEEPDETETIDANGLPKPVALTPKAKDSK